MLRAAFRLTHRSVLSRSALLSRGYTASYEEAARTAGEMDSVGINKGQF